MQDIRKDRCKVQKMSAHVLKYSYNPQQESGDPLEGPARQVGNR